MSEQKIDFIRAGDGELEGFGRVNRNDGRNASPIHEARVAAATIFLSDVLNSRTPSWWLKEAIRPSSREALRVIDGQYPGFIREGHSTSDFPLLMGDVLDRMMLARYNEAIPAWRSFVKVSRPLRDFRTVRRVAVDGAEDQYDKIEEYGPVPYTNMSETGYTYAPDLYAKGVKLSFRMIMNDDLDAFDTVPDRLGRGGRRTQSKFVTGLYVDGSGPHASFFTGGNGNLLTGNPVLSVASLGTAMQTMMGFTDTDGEPITVVGVVLVVPPGLFVTAQNILNQLTVDVTAVGGTSSQTIRVNNWIAQNVRLVVDHYIPITASTANGNTSWFLFSNPNSGRPALEFGPLAGFGVPALYRKQPNAVRVGGGVDANSGDFETMATHYKGVIGHGGTRLDPKSAVASNGSGS